MSQNIGMKTSHFFNLTNTVQCNATQLTTIFTVMRLAIFGASCTYDLQIFNAPASFKVSHKKEKRKKRKDLIVQT